MLTHAARAAAEQLNKRYTSGGSARRARRALVRAIVDGRVGAAQRTSARKAMTVKVLPNQVLITHAARAAATRRAKDSGQGKLRM